ncbi:response regulator transcription factor [Methylobacterium sp. NMS14P]|uniref:LuxR C-terminal-related transcriptional regulator n=1 Tax=Methylobacterium sp. NMS14P TaxID=2894310 RepID=UPI002359A243|nr:response regulator transcription factor [Methylobacterium sp. NMS14P]WCS23738.1 response regulator transcription factor [Methylobacterium sp. NMS14P]
MSTTVGVLILDEPQDLSATARAALEHLPGISLLGETALENAADEPRVAVICLSADKLAGGIERVAGLRKRRQDLRILLIFDALTASHSKALLDAGADAFVGRPHSQQELRVALLALVEGAACLVPREQPGVMKSGQSCNFGLSPREIDVLCFLCAGFSNKEVARRLALSVRTVETHRLNLRRKTQTGRLKDLVSLARQLGLPLPSADEWASQADKRFAKDGRSVVTVTGTERHSIRADIASPAEATFLRKR